MYTSELGFLSKEGVATFTSHEDNVFIFMTSDTLTPENLVEFGQKLKDDILYEKPNSLIAFETQIATFFQREKIVVASAAFVIIVKDVCYLVTKGQGAVYLRRGKQVGTLLTSDKTASGFCMNGDLFILGTDNLFSEIPSSEFIEASLNKSTKEIVAMLEAYAVEHGKKNMQGLFILLTKQEDILSEEKKPDKPPVFIATTPKSKKITFFVVILLGVVLIWSVVFGYQRRLHDELMKKVAISKEKIEEKLTEATDLSTLNISRSEILLAEAKLEYEGLKKIVGNTKIKQVDELGQKIGQASGLILKKEDKKYEEYYDLKLINKSASATDMYLDSENAVFLNPDAGEFYTLSLPKKSAQTIRLQDARSAKLIGAYNDDVFLYIPGTGLYKVGEDKKAKLVIKADDWKKIVDFSIYNGNIYVLDAGKNDVYKYLVAENGYSDVVTYFKGSIPDLSDAVSLAIDSSLYIATKGFAYKFTAGLRDEFVLNIPDKDGISFNKIFTSSDTTSVYLLDTKNSSVYVFSKEGQYEKQIDSSIFAKATDMVVLESENGIFVLVKDKIYKVPLE